MVLMLIFLTSFNKDEKEKEEINVTEIWYTINIYK